MRAVPLLMLTFACQLLSAQEKLLPVFHFDCLDEKQGLSNDIRSNIIRDKQGYVWVGIVPGVARYDGYEFKHYRPVRDDPHSLGSDHPFALLGDSRGRVWVGTMYGNLSLYVPERDNFTNISLGGADPASVRDDWVSALYEDRTHALWVGTQKAVYRITFLPGSDDAPPDSLLRFMEIKRFPIVYPRANGILETPEGALLMGVRGGIYSLDRKTDAFTRLRFEGEGAAQLNDSIRVNALALDGQGHLWFSVSGKGLVEVDRQRRLVRHLQHRAGDPRSISSNSIWSLLIDARGWLWAGTETGLDLVDRETGDCIQYLAADRSPRKCWAYALSSDADQILWISTLGDGLFRLSPRSFRFPHFAIQDFGKAYVNIGLMSFRDGNALWSVHDGAVLVDPLRRVTLGRFPVGPPLPGDSSAGVWCGVTLGETGMFVGGGLGSSLYRFDLRSGRRTTYSYARQFPGVIPYWVRGILPAPEGKVWVGGYNNGLLLLDPRTGVFGQKTPGATAWNIFQDRSGQIWIGSDGDGLTVYDPADGSRDVYRYDAGNPRSLSHDFVTRVSEDSKGRIWIGARNGLNLLDPDTRSFTHVDAGIPGHDWDITLIADDRRGSLWTNYRGRVLSRRSLADNSFVDFDTTDGLSGAVINGLATLQDGSLMLVGNGGVNIFHPDSLRFDSKPPRLAITSISVNNEPIALLLTGGVEDPLVLPYDRNVVEMEFAALEFDAPQLVKYSYRLEGLEDEWVEPQGRRFVRYAGLNPGKYAFHLKAVNVRNFWPAREAVLRLTITPPWWRSAWAYAAYGLFAFGLLYAGYRLRMRQFQLRQQAELEHVHAEHLAEVDRMKSRFFANISHEFRTPLTLILGPIQKWRDQLGSGPPSPETQKALSHDLGMMQRNADRLVRLINQLLDLSKLESGAMKLRASRMNIVPLVKGIANSFESSAGIREIQLRVDVGEGEIELYADRDMLEKTLANLLSNAFKFTPEGGSVVVSLRRVQAGGAPEAPSNSHEEELTPRVSVSGEMAMTGYVELSVADTGIGIPADQMDRVFDRFYQVDSSQNREHEGSGIGLALVKELVELHHGTIQVGSEPAKGTVFTVRLPLGRSHLKDEEIAEMPVSASPASWDAGVSDAAGSVEPAATDTGAAQGRGDRPIILVVEDNADVREYIKGYLVPAYSVVEARDGAEGVEKALDVVPDLVISDVMMPKKDGYEVCKALKGDERTSHIPIILLTAKAGSESKIEGLETGADDYLVKPFEPKELLVRVRNLIDQRRKLRQRFNVAVPLKPGEIAVTSVDDAFLQRVKGIVEKRMAEQAFNVEELAREACMSRMQLHRKLKSLTSLAPSDFIRYMRLHRGMDLLKRRAGTVSEISYQVGFDDPSHFSRGFHAQFGVKPSEILKEPQG